MFEAFSAVFRHVDSRLWHRYRHVFFNSAETRSRAERGGLLVGLDGRHEVVHPGVDWQLLQPSWTYDPYFLIPGRIMWTKNIELALDSFVRLKRESAAAGQFRLVVAGHLDHKSSPYLKTLRARCSGRDDVEFVISPSDARLRELYRACYAVLFPAFNEDWGIVPLEANAFGKPVIAIDGGGPVESQANGKTGFLVNANVDAFARAMARLVEDEGLVHRLGRSARAHAQRYDWFNFVSRIDDVMETIARSQL
jgi:glycosyltransferase involved in cell wall biosynthesis